MDGHELGRRLRNAPGDVALRAYTDAKVPFFWEIIRHADDWAQEIGWEPGPSEV